MDDIFKKKYKHFFIDGKRTLIKRNTLNRFIRTSLFQEYISILDIKQSQIVYEIQNALLGQYPLRITSFPILRQYDDDYYLDYVALVLFTQTRFIYFTFGTKYCKYHDFLLKDIENIKETKLFDTYKNLDKGILVEVNGNNNFIELYFSEKLKDKTIKFVKELRELCYINKNLSFYEVKN